MPIVLSPQELPVGSLPIQYANPSCPVHHDGLLVVAGLDSIRCSARMSRPNPQVDSMLRRFCAWLAFLAALADSIVAGGAEPTVPHEIVSLFNGKDLTGLTTWLKDTQKSDPRKVFQVQSGIIHLSGEGNGQRRSIAIIVSSSNTSGASGPTAESTFGTQAFCCMRLAPMEERVGLGPRASNANWRRGVLAI